MNDSATAAVTHDDKITLDQPIQRGEQAIDTLSLRKPKVGDLRGISLVDLAQMDVAALEKLLPRIATPLITDADVRNMDIADLVQLGSAVASFLLPKSAKAAASIPA